jgi:hypothetical protein
VQLDKDTLSSTHGGGPAFPTPNRPGPGLTNRELFASQFMAALMGDTEFSFVKQDGQIDDHLIIGLARVAVQAAGHLLSELE